MAAFKKREQKLVDRLKASGRAVTNIQHDARFGFVVRPFTTVGVETGSLASWFENEIFAAVSELQLESQISGIAIFPTIFDRNIAHPPKDYVKYKRDDKSVFVGINMDFSLWDAASEQERIGLLSENIKRSIERVPSAHLSKSDREKLTAVTDQVHERLLRRVLH